MVEEVIVLGHKVSSRGLEVDRAKIVAIEKLPPPNNVKGIRSFLGHAGFIVDLLKIFLKSLNPCAIVKKNQLLILMIIVCRRFKD